MAGCVYFYLAIVAFFLGKFWEARRWVDASFPPGDLVEHKNRFYRVERTRL